MDFLDEVFDEVMKWNVYFIFWVICWVLKGMVVNKWGWVINILFIEGKIGKFVFFVYIIVKYVVIGMMKLVVFDVGIFGVIVNVICLGFIIIDIVKNNGFKIVEFMGMIFEEMVDFFV